MASWIMADTEMRVTDVRGTSADGWHRVKQTLSGSIRTYDDIPLYLWDGGENVLKRDDQSIERERRERRNA